MELDLPTWGTCLNSYPPTPKSTFASKKNRQNLFFLLKTKIRESVCQTHWATVKLPGKKFGSFIRLINSASIFLG
jgi:hypothetical protein